MHRLRLLFLAPAAVWLVLMPAAAPVAAAEGRALPLAEAIARALAQNQEIAIERQSSRIAAATVDQALGAYDFQLSLASRYTDQTDPVNSVLSGALPGSFGPTQSGLSATASASRLLPTGASLVLSTSAARYETDNFLFILSPYYQTSLGVELRQPLLENRVIDPARAAIRIAQIGQTRSQASLRQIVATSVAAVEQAYWSLAAAQRDAFVRAASVELARRQRDDVAAGIETGDRPRSDLAETTAAVELRKSALYAAQEAAARAENALKGLMLGDRGDPLWNEPLVLSEPFEAVVEPVDLEAALGQARTLRPELADAQGRIDQDAVGVEAARNRLRPRLDLVASCALRGLAGSTNSDAISIPFPGLPPADVGTLQGSLGRSYETIGDTLFPIAAIGIAVDFPLRNRTARAEAVIAQARLERSELARAQLLQRVEIEVRDAFAALSAAARRVDAARAGLEAAQAQLESATARFELGATTNFMVLTRQDDLVGARLRETAAIADDRRARIELDRAAGALLRQRGIVFIDDEPAQGAAREEGP